MKNKSIGCLNMTKEKAIGLYKLLDMFPPTKALTTNEMRTMEWAKLRLQTMLDKHKD